MTLLHFIYSFLASVVSPFLFKVVMPTLLFLFPPLKRVRVVAMLLRRKQLELRFASKLPLLTKASTAFEVSSEGELEQVRPIINRLLQRGATIELIFCSESVAEACTRLQAQAKGCLRVICLPLVSGIKLHQLISAKRLVLCRYDLYPELLLYGWRSSVDFILVSATLKDKKLQRPLTRWYWKTIYSSFNQILTATPKDLLALKALLLPTAATTTIDFLEARAVQIVERLLQKEKKLTFQNYLQFLERFSRDDRIIMGSCWPCEMQLFSDRDFVSAIADGRCQVTLVPHLLSSESLLQLQEAISKVDELKFVLLTAETIAHTLASELSGKLVILAIKGVLCELYTAFGHAFVGGGHGRSIHSVLEPYLAGSLIYVGPKTFRSSEFDLVSELSPLEVRVVDELKDFYNKHYKEQRGREVELSIRDHLAKTQCPRLEEFVNKCL
ncbi:MAG: hypothetical protein HQK50_04765 [Oligoflexia bacterium]|nr:hypothetical protein [Oligoflexia bacterium]MBF0364858.1 hypothetical protein [Oligoflexia bacterium]